MSYSASGQMDTNIATLGKKKIRWQNIMWFLNMCWSRNNANSIIFVHVELLQNITEMRRSTFFAAETFWATLRTVFFCPTVIKDCWLHIAFFYFLNLVLRYCLMKIYAASRTLPKWLTILTGSQTQNQLPASLFIIFYKYFNGFLYVYSWRP